MRLLSNVSVIYQVFFFPFLYFDLDDHSRVVLQEKWSDEDGDYINANYIRVSTYTCNKLHCTLISLF